MAENYEGISVSSGMGQGLAQVFAPYQTQYDMGEIGQVEYKNRLAKEEAARKKQESLNKSIEKIKTPQMPPDYLRLFDKTRNELLEYTKKGDAENVAKSMATLENIGMLGKSIYDKTKAAGNTVMQAEPNSFEGVEVIDEITKGGRDITIANLYDVAAEDDNRISGIRRKEKPFEFTKEMNLLQNVVPTIQDERRVYRDETMAKEGVLMAVENDAKWNKFAQQQFAAAHPEEQQTYKGDYAMWAADKYYKELLVDNKKPQPAGTNVNITNNPAETALGIGGVYENVGFEVGGGTVDGVEQPVGEMLLSGFSFAPKDVLTLAPTEAWDTKTYQRPQTRGNLQLKSGQVALADVADRDIKLPGGITIPAGSPIPTGGIAGDILKRLNIPVKKSWFVVGVDDNLKKTIAVPLTTVRSSIETGLSERGQKMFNENIAKLADIYKVQAPTIGGNKEKPTSGNKTKGGKVDLSNF